MVFTGLGLICRGVVEGRIHLILQQRDIGWLRDVERTWTLGSQGLSTDMNSFIWRTGSHMDDRTRCASSTEPKCSDRSRNSAIPRCSHAIVRAGLAGKQGSQPRPRCRRMLRAGRDGNTRINDTRSCRGRDEEDGSKRRRRGRDKSREL